ncbi:MAG: hypothetical protein JWO76_1189 [Nocardioides sp.]|nr:hypothetical protein [Nocardioides sp.]
MIVIALVMLVIVVLAALVVTYVAYPHRGEEVPAAPWLGEAMAKAVEAAPTLPAEGHQGVLDGTGDVDGPDQAPEDAQHRR